MLHTWLHKTIWGKKAPKPMERKMDMKKLTNALKDVHNNISDNNRNSSSSLEESARAMVGRACPEIKRYDVSVGYSDDFGKKLFYLDIPDQKRILVYCPVLEKAFDLIRLGTAQESKLVPCQQSFYDALQINDRNHIDRLMKANVKEDMRFITSMISCYQPTRNEARQLFKEILEDFYTEAIVE